MSQEANVLLQEIDETRNALAEKIILLEDQVKDQMDNAKSTVETTVNSVTNTVNETVGNIKDTVNETVDNLKDTFSVRRRVEEHPWVMVGISAGAGYLVGTLASRPRASGYNNYLPQPRYRSEAPAPVEPSGGLAYEAPFRSRAAGMGSQLLKNFGEMFHDEIQMVKGMVLTAAMEKLREKATEAFPNIQENIDQVMASAESKFQNSNTKSV